MAWLEKRFNADRPAADRGFDRATIMWMIGGLTALAVAVSGALYAEIGSVREEVRENRAAITDLAKGLARIEALLDERLPRDR